MIEGLKEIEQCPHCEANMIVYKRGLRTPTVNLLYELALSQKPQKIGEINGMTVSQYADFKRLCLWGLIEEIDDAEYITTRKGIMWLLGLIAIPRFVWTYRNKIMSAPVGEENSEIYVHEVKNFPVDKYSILNNTINKYEYENPFKNGDLFL